MKNVFLFLTIFLAIFGFSSSCFPENLSPSIQGLFQVYSFTLEKSEIKSTFPLEILFKCKPKDVIVRKLVMKKNPLEKNFFFLMEGISWNPTFGKTNFENNLTQSMQFKNLWHSNYVEEYDLAKSVRISRFYFIGNAETASETTTIINQYDQIISAPEVIKKAFSNFLFDVKQKFGPIENTEENLLRKHIAQAMKENSLIPIKYSNFSFPEFVIDQRVSEYNFRDTMLFDIIKTFFETLKIHCVFFRASITVINLNVKNEFIGVQIDKLLTENKLEILFLDGKAFVFPINLRE